MKADWGLISWRTVSWLGLIVLLCVPAVTAQQIPLRKIAEIRGLSVETATSRLPVELRGVVTYYDRRQHIAFIQDKTGGVYFSPKDTTIESEEPIRGMLVEMTGLTGPGNFAPCVHEEIRVRSLAAADFPRPLYPVRSRLIDPRFDSQWIEIEATVCAAEVVDGRLRLKLAFDGRQFDAYVTGDWQTARAPADLVRSDVRVRGVFGSRSDQRQLYGMQLFVPSISQIEVLDAGFELAFSQPSRAVTEVMQFNLRLTDRIRVRGVVLANLPAEGMFIRGEGGAIGVETLSPEQVSVGQQLDVVGFPAAGSVRPVLQDAAIRAGQIGLPPPPVDLQSGDVSGRELHGELVRVEARVVDHLYRPKNSLIVLESVGGRLYARVPHGGVPLERSSWLALTGICLLQPMIGGTDAFNSADQHDAGIGAYSINLVVRDDRDVVVLQRPSPWTPARIGALAAVLAGVAVATVIWVLMLRRKVRQQTKVIETKIEKEQVAEERNRIARELHDTLAQELAGITMQLDNAATRLAASPDRARESIDLARAMLRHSQAEARRSVWDLRAPAVARGDLASALDEMVLHLDRPEGPNIELLVSRPIAEVPAGVGNHVLRIAQEAVTNAIKHARPRKITVELTTNCRDLQLRVHDDGCGFDLDNHPNYSDGHFGLSGMHERAGKLRGTLSLQSEANRGTALALTVPLPAIHNADCF